jgi:DNA-directed RNA polymerase specialized sigma24 family protein
MDASSYLREALARHYSALSPEATPQEAEEAAERIMDEMERPLAERAKSRHLAGMTHNEIGAVLHVHRNTVGRLLNPEAREAYREYIREYMRKYRARKRQV